MGTNCSTRGGHFQYRVKPKSIWVQKDWLERWWSILYIYAIFPKVPNFFDKVFSKSTHPPLGGREGGTGQCKCNTGVDGTGIGENT